METARRAELEASQAMSTELRKAAAAGDSSPQEMSNGLRTIALDTKREMRNAEWLRRQADVARARGDDEEALHLYAVRVRAAVPWHLLVMN